MQQPNQRPSFQELLGKIGEQVYSPKRDNKAELEEKLYANNSIREDGKKKTIHNVIVWFIYIAFILSVITLVIRVWHFLAPTCWRWLAETDIQSIDKILFSGTIGTFIGGSIKKVFGDSDTKK